MGSTGSDTTAAAAAVQLALIRAASPARRIEACLGLSEGLIALCRATLRARRPDLDERELGLRWVELQYGAELAARVRARLVPRR